MRLCGEKKSLKSCLPCEMYHLFHRGYPVRPKRFSAIDQYERSKGKGIEHGAPVRAEKNEHRTSNAELEKMKQKTCNLEEMLL